MMNDSNPTKLRFLVAATARSGSLSLAHMIEEMFESERAGRRVMHEYASRDFYALFSNYKETEDPVYLETARRLILECPYDCIVGSGYAAWLPLFRECCGPDLTLVQLKRSERDACIHSIMENCTNFPTAYGYYSAASDATIKRMAAFHFQEMSRAAWDALPLTDKLAWYYDKTHALIEANSELFSRHEVVTTESLSDAVTRGALAELILGSAQRTPRAVHLNAHFFLERLPRECLPRMQWLMGRFDLRRAVDDDLYPLEYFLNAFIARTGYQIHKSPQIGPEDHRTDTALTGMLESATRTLEETQRLIGLLKADLSKRIADKAAVQNSPQQG